MKIACLVLIFASGIFANEELNCSKYKDFSGCSRDIKQVCGTNLRTYGSECALCFDKKENQNEHLRIKHEGECTDADKMTTQEDEKVREAKQQVMEKVRELKQQAKEVLEQELEQKHEKEQRDKERENEQKEREMEKQKEKQEKQANEYAKKYASKYNTMNKEKSAEKVSEDQQKKSGAGQFDWQKMVKKYNVGVGAQKLWMNTATKQPEQKPEKQQKDKFDWQKMLKTGFSQAMNAPALLKSSLSGFQMKPDKFMKMNPYKQP